MAPLASCAASVDTPTPSPYATDSHSFQLPITVPWHHGSNQHDMSKGIGDPPDKMGYSLTILVYQKQAHLST